MSTLVHCRCSTHVAPLLPSSLLTLSNRPIRDWLSWGRQGRNQDLLKPSDFPNHQWKPGLELKMSELPFVPKTLRIQLRFWRVTCIFRDGNGAGASKGKTSRLEWGLGLCLGFQAWCLPKSPCGDKEDRL